MVKKISYRNCHLLVSCRWIIIRIIFFDINVKSATIYVRKNVRTYWFLGYFAKYVFTRSRYGTGTCTVTLSNTNFDHTVCFKKIYTYTWITGSSLRYCFAYFQDIMIKSTKLVRFLSTVSVRSRTVALILLHWKHK